MAALILATVLLAGIAATSAAQAQTYTVLYNFGEVPGDPEIFRASGLVAQGRDGNLYTTSDAGGTLGGGTAFKITTAGALTVLYNFSVTGSPYSDSGLALGTDGYYYGATFYGGTHGWGSVFKFGRGQLTTLYSFTCGSDGAYPFAPPIQGVDGNLYGTSAGGGYLGCSSQYGTVYKLTPSGEFTSLYQFDGTQGAYPSAPLIQAMDGNFYGTTQGPYGPSCVDCGSVFKITPAGVLTTLHLFDGTDGQMPFSPLVQGSDGNFYGTTTFGGDTSCRAPFGCGVVFKLTPTGVYSILHIFDLEDGAAPLSALVQATDGNFYGTTDRGGTMDDGTIFRISPQGDFAVLYNFDGTTGSNPEVALLPHTNGVLYGDTLTGDIAGAGVFFSLDVGAPPFVRLLPTAGLVGKPVEILGQGFTGTTSVAFNGVSASYTVRSDTFLTATVPAGATTGYVKVTTPTGTLKSNKKFIVK